MKVEYMISMRGSAHDLLIFQGNTCIKLYGVQAADFQKLAKELGDLEAT